MKILEITFTNQMRGYELYERTRYEQYLERLRFKNEARQESRTL